MRQCPDKAWSPNYAVPYYCPITNDLAGTATNRKINIAILIVNGGLACITVYLSRIFLFVIHEPRLKLPLLRH